jgi:hypothetical protein
MTDEVFNSLIQRLEEMTKLDRAIAIVLIRLILAFVFFTSVLCGYTEAAETGSAEKRCVEQALKIYYPAQEDKDVAIKMNLDEPESEGLSYTLNIRLLRNKKENFVYDENPLSLNYQKLVKGDGVFLEFNKPGFITLAVEDDDAHIYQKELYCKLTKKNWSFDAKEYGRATGTSEKWGVKYNLSPGGWAKYLKDPKFQETAKFIVGEIPVVGTAFSVWEVAKELKTPAAQDWGLTTETPQIDMVDGTTLSGKYNSTHAWKDPHWRFHDESFYDIHEFAWEYLTAPLTQDQRRLRGEGYSLHYRFNIQHDKPENVTLLRIRAVIPYTRHRAADYAKYGMQTLKYAELEWTVGLKARTEGINSSEAETGSTSYQIFSQAKTRAEASQACADLKGSIVQLDTQGEQEVIMELMQRKSVTHIWATSLDGSAITLSWEGVKNDAELGTPASLPYVCEIPIAVSTGESKDKVVAPIDRIPIDPNTVTVSMHKDYASKKIGTKQYDAKFGAPQGYTQEYENPDNLASLSKGAKAAVAKDTVKSPGTGAEDIHKPQFVNDGKYGNASSWIGNSGDSWIKIDLGKKVDFNRIKFGRDRVGGYTDRYPGKFRILVSDSGDIYQNGNEDNDANEYTEIVNSTEKGFKGRIGKLETIVVTFPKVSARFVKITVSEWGACIDEIEVDNVE